MMSRWPLSWFVMGRPAERVSGTGTTRCGRSTREVADRPGPWQRRSPDTHTRWSSPARMCAAARPVDPLCAAGGLRPEISEALAPHAGGKALALVEQLIQAGPRTVVLCPHREVLADLLPGLSCQFDVTLGHRLPGAKGSMWILQVHNQKITSVSYQTAKK